MKSIYLVRLESKKEEEMEIDVQQHTNGGNTATHKKPLRKFKRKNELKNVGYSIDQMNVPIDQANISLGQTHIQFDQITELVFFTLFHI